MIFHNADVCTTQTPRQAHVCYAGDDTGLRGEYNLGMIARIGPKKPRRNFLAQWRKDRELTQEQLAERVGTYKGQISNWENGNRSLSFDVLSALAEALNIEPMDIFRDPKRPSADELLRDAPPAVHAQVIDLIKVLVQRR